MTVTDFQLPPTFPPSRLAPSRAELVWIYDWLRHNLTPKARILEFGCGVTTWAIYTAVEPSVYVAVERWEPCIRDTKRHLPKVEIVTTTWHDIPAVRYDLVFVDSSAGCPHGRPGLFRHEAVEFAERLAEPDAYVMLHDWHRRSGRRPRRYLEDNGYRRVAELCDRSGVGVYQR